MDSIYTLSTPDVDDMSVAVISTSTAGPKPQQSTISLSELEEQLTEFIIVPRSAWMGMTKGTFVKYITTDGHFHNGSYIKSYNETADTGKDNSQYFVLESRRFGNASTPDSSYVTFPIYCSDIRILYKRISNVNAIEFSLIRGEFQTLYENIARLERDSIALTTQLRNSNATIEDLKTRLTSLEQKRSIKAQAACKDCGDSTFGLTPHLCKVIPAHDAGQRKHNL